MRKYLIALLIITLLIPSVALAGNNPSDIEGHWANGYIKSLVDKGVINGYPDGTFKPDDSIAKDAFIKLVVVALGYNVGNAQGYWAQNYIDKAIELNLISLDEFDNYTKAIKREEMASIVVNAVYLNESRNKDVNDLLVRDAMKDYMDVSDKYKQAVIDSYKIGLITGKGNGLFDPQGTASRAEASTIIIRQLDTSIRQPFEYVATGQFTSPMVDATTHYVKYEKEYNEEYSKVVEISDDNREVVGLVKELLKLREEKLLNHKEGYISLFGSTNGTGFSNAYFRNMEDALHDDFAYVVNNTLFSITSRAVSRGVSNTTEMDDSNYTYRIFISSNAESERYEELMEYHRDTFETIFGYLFTDYEDYIMTVMKEVMYEPAEVGKFKIKETVVNGRRIMFRKAHNGMSVFISNGDERTVYNTTYSDITGKKAHDFELESLTGDKVKLSDYKSKNVLVTFFTTWCPCCKEEMSIIEQINKDNDDIEILAINVGESKEKVASFKQENGLTVPILLDGKDIAKEYSIKTIPASFFIDKDGNVYTFYKGKLTYVEITNIINQMK